jgi:hypothetical protein
MINGKMRSPKGGTFVFYQMIFGLLSPSKYESKASLLEPSAKLTPG